MSFPQQSMRGTITRVLILCGLERELGTLQEHDACNSEGKTAAATFYWLLVLLFSPENGSNMFLQKSSFL
jgi:hypothetical protein